MDWLPNDFKREMEEILGEEYGRYLESFDKPANRGLRVNTLKWTREECIKRLPFKTLPIPWISNGLFYEDEMRPSKDPYYFAGLYYLQEPSAMTPASLLPVEPGDMVLDICGAPGGKSTELGARLMGRGMLVANDISNSRAKALLKNLELFGVPNICVVSEPPKRLSSVFSGFFDKILVDAPCSGEGMFRKDRDMVTDWTEKGPEYYSGIQRGIAGEAVKMLKAGGYLLYSTCTFSRTENEGTVRWILEEFPDMEMVELGCFPGASHGIGLKGCIRLFPHKIQGEGHFMALLRKREVNGEEKTRDEEREVRRKPCRMEELRGAYKRGKSGGKAFFKSGNVTEKNPEVEEFLKKTRIPWDTSRIAEKDGMIYYLPEGFVDGTGLRFLRTGLWMGTLKNGRFEPSQAMAMVLGGKLYSDCLTFDREDPRVVRYLKGETISLKEGEAPVKGWCLVCVDGFALGFGKGSGMTVKNKYYAGWRWQ